MLMHYAAMLMPAKSIIYCDKPPKLKCFSINKTDEILMI